MGFETNYTFPQIYSPPLAFGGLTSFSSTSSKTETEEEIKARLKKQADARYQKYLEEQKNKKLQEEKAEIESPLTKKERNVIMKGGLKIDRENRMAEEAGLGASLLFTTPFLYPQIKSALKTSKKTVDMFYKQGAVHMDLFTKNPDLMMEAQGTMQKLERKFRNDFKAAKGDKALQRKIMAERNHFRTLMQNSLNSSDPQKLAEATEQCKVAKGVKNGWFTRLFRGWKKNPKIKSRLDAVTTADTAGKFSSVKPPKECTSFWKNLRGNKLTWAMTAAMAAIPVLLDWSNIQKAKKIDTENEQKGKDTNYAGEQITQTAIKGGASAITYMVMDTGARTLSKKFFGKFAAKMAAKIAVKGGCKVLGAVVGSVAPGIGTAFGLLAGTVADYLLNKYVLSNMDFFKDTSVTKGELASSDDGKLLQQLSEQYAMGAKLDKDTLAILERKCGPDNFKEMQRIHNMPEKERTAYLSELNKQAKQTLNPAA